ncbi:MAG: carotenoid biosynthesis protein [Chloroflexota bacterium]|nr:carotenoid biosynthesis protein [Chloroflexota bacterium]
MKHRPVKGQIKLPDEPALIRGLVTIYIVGIVGHLVPIGLSVMLWLTPFVLLISGIMVLIPLRKTQPLTFWLWCGGVVAITFLVEVIGVTTGAVFGPYEYGSTLGPGIWGVPLLICWNWLFIILGAIGISQRIRHPVLFAMLVGTLVVLFDFTLEPVAIKLDYWEWHLANIAPQNYFAWFAIAFVAAIGYRGLKLVMDSRIPRSYFAIQLLFFLVLRLFL